MIVYLGFLALAPKKAPMDGAAIFDFDLALLDGRFLDFELGDRRFVVIVVSPAAVKAWASSPQETDPDQAHVGRLVLVVMPWRYPIVTARSIARAFAAITAKALRNIAAAS